MSRFENAYKEWLEQVVLKESNPRRREILQRGLGYGSEFFLRKIWFPVVGNFNNLHPEWEVRDFKNGYRYLDFAFMPGGVKGGIEVQGFGPHARDVEMSRFNDLCMRHSLLTLDGWIFLPISFQMIKYEPKVCQQLILSFIGRFVSIDVSNDLSWLEAETVRLARRLLRPITSQEVAHHLRISNRHASRILNNMVHKESLKELTGQLRYRLYVLN